MATHLSKLKKRNGDIILPITRSEGVILDDGTTVLQTKLDAIDYAIDNIDLSSKQDVLVSTENIKSINGSSVLGSGNLEIKGGQLLGTAEVRAIAYNAQTIAENIIIPSTYNAMSVGTITIEDGYTVTLEDGAIWVII